MFFFKKKKKEKRKQNKTKQNKKVKIKILEPGVSSIESFISRSRSAPEDTNLFQMGFKSQKKKRKKN